MQNICKLDLFQFSQIVPRYLFNKAFLIKGTL